MNSATKYLCKSKLLTTSMPTQGGLRPTKPTHTKFLNRKEMGELERERENTERKLKRKKRKRKKGETREEKEEGQGDSKT